MRLYLRANHQAAINFFREEASEKTVAALEAINAHNAAISQQVYNYIQDGCVGYQKAGHGARMWIIHQSIHRPGTIQISHFCIIRGKWEALSHSEANSPAELQRELMPGKYVSIRRF